jgi:hypothetical protein
MSGENQFGVDFQGNCTILRTFLDHILIIFHHTFQFINGSVTATWQY